MKQFSILSLILTTVLFICKFSCKGKNEVEIELEKSEIFSQELISFCSKTNFKDTLNEWEIVETDFFLIKVMPV